jgi:hypothetical protein
VASVSLACFSLLFAEAMKFREGLTPIEAQQQMRVGVVGGIIIALIAGVLAIFAFRQRPQSASSHVAAVMSLGAAIFIVLQWLHY